MAGLVWGMNTQRIAIAGAPRAGKTTLALQMGGPVRHADDLIATHGWSEASAELARWLLEPGPYVIEGVAVLRGLRKALELVPGKPCDQLVWLAEPYLTLSSHQRGMFTADRKRLAELEPELVRRGVVLIRAKHP